MVDDPGRSWQQDEAIQSAWGHFLEPMGFDGWFTLTYRQPANSSILAIDRAQRVLKNYFKGLKRRPVAFIVAEEHTDPSRGYHAHGLVRLGALDDGQAAMMCHGLWQESLKTFGLNRFEIIRDGQAVRAYVAKYLTKRIADHRFIGKI